MTPDQYVEKILKKYEADSSVVLRSARPLYPLIQNWAGDNLSNIKLSGSFAKGTATTLGTDVDLFISLKSSTIEPLSEVYNTLLNMAFANELSPLAQRVSIGCSVAGVKVDLVPGKIQTGRRNFHSLYNQKSDSWTKTNIDSHVNMVSSSGRCKVIRALKIWKALNQLDFPSFYLELFAIGALKGKRSLSISENFLYAINSVGSNLSKDRIVDPANSSNVISDDLTQSEKYKIMSHAISTGSQLDWKDMIW